MISLTVNGKAFAGWERARVTRGIESIAGSFDLQVSDRWNGKDDRWLIAEGDECTVSVGDEKVITGYVDRRSLSYAAREHTLSFSGRDKTGDLVDCSCVLDKWQFRNIQAQSLAMRVCEPYGITVKVQARLGSAEFPPVAKLSIDPGDTAFDAIDKACRLAGVLPVSDGQGNLLLTRAGTARCPTALVEGKNILAASADYDASSRFRHYFVLGQHQGTDEMSGHAAAQIKAFAEDENVTRVARSLLIRPEGSVTTAYAKTRAQWEAKVRAARSDSVSVTVQGWTQANGIIWPINALVQVDSPSIGVSGEMLITQAVYSADSSGTQTVLTLKPPNAFIPEPVVKVVDTRKWKSLAGGV